MFRQNFGSEKYSNLSWLLINFLNRCFQVNTVPAAGWFNGSASLSNEGTNGYYWSSSWNSATNGYNLNFNNGNVNPQNNNNRYYGLPVRAVLAE